MRTWKVFLLSVVVSLGVVVAVGACLRANGALALSLGQPSSPAIPEAFMYGVPPYMNYQGLLLDDQGNPIAGEHELIFTVYQWNLIPSGWDWTVVYSQTETMTLDQGLFNVALGVLDREIFDGLTPGTGALELGVKVDGGTELSPRAPLYTSPYAFRSQFTNNMPYQRYNSGWTNSPGFPGGITFDHNLGGYPHDYVVVLDCQDDTLGTYQCVATSGIHAYWHDLTDTQITVYIPNAGKPDKFRVRIWVSE